MIIDNFNIVGIIVLPDKTETELVIDSYAILTSPVTFKTFQPIPWGALQILQGLGGS